MDTMNSTPTEKELRTSMNNMLCVVPYEELSADEQSEIEEILQVVNG